MEEEVCDASGWWKIDLSSESTCKCYTTGLCQSAAFRKDNIIDWLIVFYIFLYIFIYYIYFSHLRLSVVSWKLSTVGALYLGNLINLY